MTNLTERVAKVLQQINDRLALVGGIYPHEQLALCCLKTAIEGMLQQRHGCSYVLPDLELSLTTLCDQWEMFQSTTTP